MFYFRCCYGCFFKIWSPSFCSGSKPFNVIQQKGAILHDLIYSSVSRVINIEILNCVCWVKAYSSWVGHMLLFARQSSFGQLVGIWVLIILHTSFSRETPESWCFFVILGQRVLKNTVVFLLASMFSLQLYCFIDLCLQRATGGGVWIWFGKLILWKLLSFLGEMLSYREIIFWK